MGYNMPLRMIPPQGIMGMTPPPPGMMSMTPNLGMMNPNVGLNSNIQPNMGMAMNVPNNRIPPQNKSPLYWYFIYTTCKSNFVKFLLLICHLVVIK